MKYHAHGLSGGEWWNGQKKWTICHPTYSSHGTITFIWCRGSVAYRWLKCLDMSGHFWRMNDADDCWTGKVEKENSLKIHIEHLQVCSSFFCLSVLIQGERNSESRFWPERSPTWNSKNLPTERKRKGGWELGEEKEKYRREEFAVIPASF